MALLSRSSPFAEALLQEPESPRRKPMRTLPAVPRPLKKEVPLGMTKSPWLNKVPLPIVAICCVPAGKELLIPVAEKAGFKTELLVPRTIGCVGSRKGLL